MSGNVPPPPPPPGPAPQGPGADSPHETVRRPATAAVPPSFAPGSSSEARATGSWSTTAGPAPAPAAPTAVQQPTASPHAPVPPAPASPAPGPTGPPPAPTVQAPAAGYTAPVRQPAYQPAAYRQPEYHQPTYETSSPQQYGYTPQQYAYQQASPPTGTAQAPVATAPPRRPARRLSPGWIVFIVADVILIVVAVAFAINVLGGSGGPPVAGGTEPDAVASQDAQGDAAAEDVEEGASGDPGASVAEFASPSRNISCEVFENQVSCAIAELNQQPAPVEGCEGTTGYVVTLDAQGKVALPCVPGADKPKKAPKKQDQVPYGESVTEGDFTCSSEQDGMYCQHDPSGKGFSLARAGVGTY